MISERLKTLNQRLLPGRLLYGPRWLVLGVNTVCNLHCKMCDVGTNTPETNFAYNLLGAEPRNMPLSLFEEICAQARTHWPDVTLGYAFTEPLLYDALEASLEVAQRSGLATTITTNALMLKKKADVVHQGGVRDLFVSLDGLEAEHNEIRGHKHSFQRALDGLESLWERGSPTRTSVYCVITEWNYTTLGAFVDFFADRPLTELGFMHPNFTPPHVAALHNARFGHRYPATESNVAECTMENIDLDRLWEEIAAVRKRSTPFPVRFSPEIRTRSQLSLFYTQPETLYGRRCTDAFTAMMIKADGSVIPAHGRCYPVPVGDLHTTPLKGLWNAPALARFRTTLTDSGGLLPACSRCCSAFG